MMITLRLDFPGTRRFAVAVMIMAMMGLAVGGCTSAPADRLAGNRDGVLRHLTMQCFRNHEGERVVYGALPVYIGCRSWARDRVRVVMPESTSLTLH